MAKKECIDADAPLSTEFGLSYASWLVWPRVLMQAMPVEWQKKFIALSYDLHERFSDWEPEGTFSVGLRKNGRMAKLPEELCNYRRPVEKYRKPLEYVTEPRTLQQITDAARRQESATEEELRLAIVAYDVLLAQLALENDPKQLEKFFVAAESDPRTYVGPNNDPDNPEAREWHKAFINIGENN